MTTIAVQFRSVHDFAGDVPYLMQCVWDDAQIRPELVREVDLGPFKHKQDDGLPLRKAAFSCASGLLTAYGQTMSSEMLLKLMDLVKLGMADHEDVQIICCQILSDLCAANWGAVSGRVKDLIEVYLIHSMSLFKCTQNYKK